MTRKERALVVLIAVTITALILMGIWSLQPGEITVSGTPQGISQPPVVPEDTYENPPEEVVGPDRDRTRIPIKMRPEVEDGGSIEGKVVDETGGPLLNAAVTAMQKNNPVRYAFTSAEGTYAIRGLSPGYYDVRADREGYAVASRRNIQVARLQATRGVDFELIRGSTFSGSVVSMDEEPIAGASVTLYASGVTDDPRSLVRSFRAKTDAGGEFSIENVPPGEYRTLAQQEAYLPSERITLTITDAAAATHKFVLELGGSVAGTVTDTEENPVADVQVWLSSAEGQIVFSRGARTGADGSYALQGLQEGTVNVRVLAQGFMTATKEDIQIFKGRPTEGVDFVLDRGKFISGVVVNALGEPVKNAVVSGSDTNSYKNVKTDQNGEFVLSGFSGDSVNLSVRVTGYVLLIRRAIPANTEDLRFVLHKGGSVEGQAISDMPLKSFVVILYTIPEEGKQRRIARQKISSDPEGHFKVGDIPEGIYTVEVHSKDYIQVRPLTVEVREDSTVSGLQILMRAR